MSYRSRDSLSWVISGAKRGQSLAVTAHEAGLDSTDVREALRSMGLYGLWEARRAALKAKRILKSYRRRAA